MTYVLRSRVRPRLTDPAIHDHEPRELTTSAETYDAALAQLRDQVPEGWVLLGIIRYDDQPTV